MLCISETRFRHLFIVARTFQVRSKATLIAPRRVRKNPYRNRNRIVPVEEPYGTVTGTRKSRNRTPYCMVTAGISNGILNLMGRTAVGFKDQSTERNWIDLKGIRPNNTQQIEHIILIERLITFCALVSYDLVAFFRAL
jgi:hypothetical protein